jgi:PAS domain S-box-containing protein
MDDHSQKERFFEYTVFSVLIAIVLFIFSLFFNLTASAEADFSMNGILWLFKHNPVIWLIVLYSFLFPIAVNFLVRKLSRKLMDKQKIINAENSRIEQVTSFTQQLIHNNLDVEFKLSGNNDVLGETLINLRNTLKTNEENDQKQRKAEEERNWLAEGSAHFSEILRNYIHEPDQLAFHVIKDLTKYVNAIQGGFYVLEDNDSHSRYFNLSAFFAYDRRKFADQKIKWGDGLIGTCALEKKTIHLKNVPDSYITVTSGLGEASPDCLIVVPMIYEDHIFGVLEFASFSQFQPNLIALIEKTAESVAATLSAIKTNQRTARLLEESKAQTQALTSHEEEMRQNMEELQATQEESTRQSFRLVQIEEALKRNIIHVEFDPEGKYIYGNNLFYIKFEYSNDLKIEGKHIGELISEENRDWFATILNNLTKEHKPYKGYLKHVTRTGKDLWIMATLSVSLRDDKSVDKIIFLGIDFTEEREQLQKQETMISSINNSSITLELDVNGNLLHCNDIFIQLFRLSQKDIKSLVIFDIVSPLEMEAFNKKWDAIIHGSSYSGLLRAKTAKGEEIWLNGSFSTTLSTAHEIDRIIFVGINLTHEKLVEHELQSALETLKKQERQIKDAEKELGNKLRETKLELMNQFKEIEKIKNLNEKMLEDNADAIITTSQENHIIFFNKAAEQLWEMNRNEVLNEDIGILFPESLTEKDELLSSFVRPGDHKITGQRKKSMIIAKDGKEKKVLILLTKGRVDSENAYMAFIQPV